MTAPTRPRPAALDAATYEMPAATTPALGVATPVAPQERVALLDVLRGFALWGVCLANLEPWLAGYSGLSKTAKQALPTWRVDRVVDAFLSAFVHGRFIMIFSFLFGLGFAVQLLRAEARGADGTRLFARRIAAMFALGAVHAYLIWAGDITHIYAALAVPLLFVRRWPVRRLVAVGVALLVVQPIAWMAFSALAPVFTNEALSPGAAYAVLGELRAHRLPQLYSGTSYLGILRGNRAIHDAMLHPWVSLGWAPELLGLFLLGLATGRAGLVSRIDAHRPAWRAAFGWSLVAGLVGFLPGLAISLLQVQARIPADVNGMLRVLRAIGQPAMSLAYVCGVVLLFQRPAWRRRLLALAPVGRMAYTNYLSQSVIGIAIFYGVGLGLYGKVGPALLVALSVAIISAQGAASRWWLRRFRFGPAEWVWRSLTYGRPQPMRLGAGEARAPEAAAA
jgi:uncharacterized protein